MKGTVENSKLTLNYYTTMLWTEKADAQFCSNNICNDTFCKTTKFVCNHSQGGEVEMGYVTKAHKNRPDI